MTRIVLIRHATPEIDPTKHAANWRLAPEGMAGAAALAPRLNRFTLAEIWSSPEPKAVGTANIIAQRLSVPVRLDDDFAEHRRPSVGFLQRDAFEEGIRRLFRQPRRQVFGDETADAAYGRFAAAIERHQAATSAGDMAVVTHGTILTIYVDRVVSLPDPFMFWKSLALPDAVVLEDGRLGGVP